jgi:hypothetical protein
MTILDDTDSYETWLGRFIALQADDLDYKHAVMADPDDPFPFFRGTYYRWLRHWPGLCPDLAAAPRVQAVGDLHVENFGLWRDKEGRLAWGVNDFDEAGELPFTNDLVRLACSTRCARAAGALELRLGDACKAILSGYQSALETGGTPFVLEENHPQLRRLAYAKERDPAIFWKKLTRLLNDPEASPPAEARAALLHDLPARGLPCQFRIRPRVGVGSLGKPRFVVLAEWAGGWVAREAKALAPAASAWLAGEAPPAFPRIGEVVNKAIRCHDPFYRVEKPWIVRRLSPRCSRIELTQQCTVEDQAALFAAMGAETANIHLGSGSGIEEVQRDLKQRPEGWLKDAARRTFHALRADWQEWRAASALVPCAKSNR